MPKSLSIADRTAKRKSSHADHSLPSSKRHAFGERHGRHLQKGIESKSKLKSDTTASLSNNFEEDGFIETGQASIYPGVDTSDEEDGLLNSPGILLSSPTSMFYSRDSPHS